MRIERRHSFLSAVTCAAMVALCACTATAGSPSESSIPPSTSPTSDAVASPSSGPAFTAPAGGLVYLALGDSNVYGSPGDCGDCVTYPHLLTTQLMKQTGKPVTLIDGSEHNRQTTGGLLSAIQKDSWYQPEGYPNRSPLKPREAIAAADLITITLGANMMPWYEDKDPCGKVYDKACVAQIEEPVMKEFDGILSEIDTIRGGKPTAVRLTTFANDLIKGPDYDPAVFSSSVDSFSAETITQALTTARSFLDTWSGDLCAISTKHGAKCVDIYAQVAGPERDQALPTGYYTAQYGDMNQGGQDLFAAAIADSGLAPLDLGN